MGRQGIKRRKKKGNVTVSHRSTIFRFIKNNLAWFSYGLTYFIIISMIFMLMAVMCGCGHSVTHTDRGTGLVARIPLPDGSSLIDIKIGKIDSTTTVLRGNSTYDSSASTGGTIFGSASTSDRTFVATGIQLNEGYMAEVLQSPDVDPATKVALAQALVQVQANKPKPTVTKAVGAATSSGDTPNTSVEPVAVGVDNIVNRVAETAPKVVVPVAAATKDVVKDVTTTVDTISKDWKTNIISIVVAVIVAFVIIALVVYVYIRKRNNTNAIAKDDRLDTNNDEQPQNVESPKDVKELQ